MFFYSIYGSVSAVLPIRDASNPLIVIDAGHGGADVGCSKGDLYEKDINLSIANHTRELLNARGYEVLMTRAGDETVSLEERVNLANENGATIYISIHQNFYEKETADVHGIETYYSAECGADGRRLAKLMQQQLTEHTDGNEYARVPCGDGISFQQEGTGAFGIGRISTTACTINCVGRGAVPSSKDDVSDL